MKKLATRLSYLFVFLIVVASMALEASKGFDRAYRASAILQVDHRYGDLPANPENGDRLVSMEDEVNTIAMTISNRDLIRSIIIENELLKNESFTASFASNNSLEQTTRALTKAVEAEVIKNTRLTQISLTFPDPILAKDLVNLVAKGYIKQQYRFILDNNRFAHVVLTNEIEGLKIKLRHAETKLTEFRRSKEVYAPLSDQQLQLSAKMRDLEKQILQISKRENQLDNDLELALSFGENPTPKQLRSVTRTMDSPEFQNYEKRRLEQEWIVDRLAVRHGSDHPVLVAERQLVELLEERINTLLLNHFTSLAAKREELKQEREILETRSEEVASELQSLDEINLEYHTLEREVKSTIALYNAGMERIRAIDPTAGLDERVISLIVEAEESKDVTPRPVPRFAMSLGLGLFIGILPIVGIRQIYRFIRKHFNRPPVQTNQSP